MAQTFIAHGLRGRRGEDCLVYKSTRNLTCERCESPIGRGQKYTVARRLSSKPCCSVCVPFQEQPALFDLPEPNQSKTKRQKPTHARIVDYEARDGEHRHRVECRAQKCGGRGWWYEMTESGQKRKTRCRECGGTGSIWKKGKVSIS